MFVLKISIPHPPVKMEEEYNCINKIIDSANIFLSIFIILRIVNFRR